MIQEKFNYLFGEYASKLSTPKVMRFFCPDDSETDLRKVRDSVRQLALYTRQKEKVECQLAKLPEITDETSADSDEMICAEKAAYITKLIEALKKKSIDFMPKLRRTYGHTKAQSCPINAVKLYHAAVCDAVQYRVLEQLRELHIESCDTLMTRYREQNMPVKAENMRVIKSSLISEYDERIHIKKTDADHKIMEFCKIVSQKPSRRITGATESSLVSVRCVAAGRKIVTVNKSGAITEWGLTGSDSRGIIPVSMKIPIQFDSDCDTPVYFYAAHPQKEDLFAAAPYCHTMRPEMNLKGKK